MKKVSAILLAMVMALCMSVTAFAVKDIGTITITNATVGQTYYLYKFFEADYSTELNSEGKPIVSYTAVPDSKFYATMFGADGKTANPYFDYDLNTHVVTKKSGVANQDVITYLDGLAAAVSPDTYITATTDTVQFTDLGSGYYLIDRGTTSTVTITTNMPDIAIIDKNQKPGNGFDKVIVEGSNRGESNVSGIGDIIRFEIPFTGTNYDGDELVKYYTIHDEKDPGLWVEFTDVEVVIDGAVKEKGYYFFAGPVNNPDGPGNNPAETGEWEWLGDWGSGDPGTRNPSEADWYLIHYGYDEFEIVIPWLTPHTFTCDKTLNTYELTFDLDKNDGNSVLATPKYTDTTTGVVVSYTAAVGPDAAFESVSKNEASLSWEHTDGPADNGTTEKTETKTHNLGITKIANDAAETPLAGAVFELYEDADCTIPVNVIPVVEGGTVVDGVIVGGSIVPGVYILDDVDINVTGKERVTSRDKYASDALTAWLAADAKPDADGTNRRNDMITPTNGQLVILGLEDGTYYVKETEAPDGYNKLALPVAVEVGTGSLTPYGSYSVYSTTIENNQGMELPSTGGEGTVRMITIGTVVAMAFAVLLITHKKMSVYHD